MIKLNQIAYGVRVKLTEEFKPKCLGDKFLMEEKGLYISEQKPYYNIKGYYVEIKGISGINSGYAYLNELELEFDLKSEYVKV